jgi:hypothetical protein
MSNATVSNIRKGGFLAAKQIYGIPSGYLTANMLRDFMEVFAAEYISVGQGHMLLCVQLHSHNALHVLQERLAVLCAKWKVERVNVVDLSDWTVREFVLDNVPSNQEG